MKALILPLILLPISVFAQDTLYIKGGMKVPVTINKIAGGKIYFNTVDGEKSMPEKSVERYYWPKGALAPKKDDNYIVIETTDTPEAAFVKLGGVLAEAGFPIAMANKEIGVITSGNKSYTAGSAVSVNAHIKPGATTKIMLSGIYDGGDMTLYGFTSEQKGILSFKGMGNSPFMKGWLEMDKVAKAYPGGTVTYGKR